MQLIGWRDTAFRSCASVGMANFRRSLHRAARRQIRAKFVGNNRPAKICARGSLLPQVSFVRRRTTHCAHCRNVCRAHQFVTKRARKLQFELRCSSEIRRGHLRVCSESREVLRPTIFAFGAACPLSGNRSNAIRYLRIGAVTVLGSHSDTESACGAMAEAITEGPRTRSMRC